VTSAPSDLRAVSDAAGHLADAGEPVEPVLRVLSDPLRRRIVTLLAVEQLCTCHLVELTGARQTNISNHLRVLREAGLVAAEPAGRFTYYRLMAGPLAALGEQLTDLAGRAETAATRRRPCP
jgi:ArsR family transcriptional regulator